MIGVTIPNVSKLSQHTLKQENQTIAVAKKCSLRFYLNKNNPFRRRRRTPLFETAFDGIGHFSIKSGSHLDV